MSVALNLENVANPTVLKAIQILLADAAKSAYKVNVFTVCTTNCVWFLNDTIEIPFTSELDAYKFATYTGFLKSSVRVVGEVFYVCFTYKPFEGVEKKMTYEEFLGK